MMGGVDPFRKGTFFSGITYLRTSPFMRPFCPCDKEKHNQEYDADLIESLLIHGVPYACFGEEIAVSRREVNNPAYFFLTFGRPLYKIA